MVVFGVEQIIRDAQIIMPYSPSHNIILHANNKEHVVCRDKDSIKLLSKWQPTKK